MIDILASKAVPIEQVAISLGHEVTRHKMRCISPDHQDKNPSLSLNSQYNRFKCFGCGYSGDVLDLVGRTLNLDLKQSYEWLMGNDRLATAVPVAIPQADHVPRIAHKATLAAYHQACTSGDYLEDKGIPSREFGVREVTPQARLIMSDFPLGGLIIPYYQHSEITYMRWRNLSTIGPRYLGLPRVDTIVYNQDALSMANGNRPLWLCEGETDTMSAHQMGYMAVGFPGATQFQLLRRLEGWLEALGDKIPSLVLAFDNDEAGNRLDDKVRTVLGDRIDMATLDLGEYKDVNEMYIHEYIQG